VVSRYYWPTLEEKDTSKSAHPAEAYPTVRIICSFCIIFFVLYCATGLNIAVGGSAETISASKKTVPVLHGDRLAIPAVKTTDQGLMTALSGRQPEEVDIFSEYLDLVRFPATQYGDDVVRYLRTRYGARKPDVVIAVGNSLELVLAHRDELFAGVPIVFANVDHREVEGREMPPNVSGLWMAWDSQRTVELALQLQPETREVVCVTGTGSEEQRWNSEARKVLGRFATRVHWPLSKRRGQPRYPTPWRFDGCDCAEAGAGSAAGERGPFSQHGQHSTCNDLDVGYRQALHLL
jgi:hypothetical protein